MPNILNILKLRKFANAGDSAVEVSTSADTQPRLRVDAGGKLNWGAGGSSSTDTTLYRSAADTLKTDDAFIAAGGLLVKTTEIDTAGATTNQVLAFNGTKFAPANATGGGGTSITISDTAPSSPTAGALWFNSATAKTFIYYDSYWVELNGGTISSTYTSDTPPASPTVGTLWYETDSGALYVYFDSFWVEIGPGAAYNQIVGSIQAKGDLIVGTGSQAISRQAVGSNGARLVADSTTSTGVAWASDATNTVIDAKGDLLAGTADNTVSRLGVGSNGTVLTADSTTATGLAWTGQTAGFRNVLINGDFRIDQRNAGASHTIPKNADTYTVDRWFTYCAGANLTGQRVSGSAPHQYYYQITGAASNSGYGISQRIEASNSAHLAGQTVTLSALLKSTTATSMQYAIYYASATDNFTSEILISQGTFSINSTMTNYQVQVSIPSNATTGLRVFIGGTGLTSGTTTFGGVQLEKGLVATPFEVRPIGTELALCQRYYQKWTGASNANFMGYSFTDAAGTMYNCTFPLITPMRANPTIGIIGTVQGFDGLVSRVLTNINNVRGTERIAGGDPSYTGGTFNANRPGYIYASSPSGLDFSAEL